MKFKNVVRHQRANIGFGLREHHPRYNILNGVVTKTGGINHKLLKTLWSTTVQQHTLNNGVKLRICFLEHPALKLFNNLIHKSLIWNDGTNPTQYMKSIFDRTQKHNALCGWSRPRCLYIEALFISNGYVRKKLRPTQKKTNLRAAEDPSSHAQRDVIVG